MVLVAFLTLPFSFACKPVGDNMYEYEIVETSVVTGEYVLPAKFTIPKSEIRVPAVVMIHGSGPNNMDEAVGKLKMFEDLSVQLAKLGVASIRYDKRSLVYLDSLSTNFKFSIDDEVIGDALSAINMLKKDDRIDKNGIYVLGHSFGGQLAPVIANRDETIKGIIIMAGTTQHIIDLLMEQLKERGDPTYQLYLPWYEYFRNLKEVVPGEENYLFAGAYEKYWTTYNNLDLVAELLECAQSKTILVMQGGKDLQVKAAQLNVYKELLGSKALYQLYNNLNHCFVDGQNETWSTMYQKSKDIPKEVVSDITNFLEQKNDQ